mmetsp:Transcript_10043/g.15150  ORF Transcript_10043/g.15150 Transcript_10043/m.15150 type:complete len:279 (+) Transcript_10043:456-1292(+)
MHHQKTVSKCKPILQTHLMSCAVWVPNASIALIQPKYLMVMSKPFMCYFGVFSLPKQSVLFHLSKLNLPFLKICLLGQKKSTLAHSNHVVVTDFYRSFVNGLAFGAILEAHSPGAINFEKKVLPCKNFVERLSLVFLRAKKHCQIPILLDPEDFRKNIRQIDELSIVLALTVWFRKFGDKASQKKAFLKTDSLVGAKGGKIICRMVFEGFKNVNGTTLSMNEDSTIAQVKQQVEKKTTIPKEKVLVFIDEKKVQDNCVLGKLDQNKKKILQIVCRPNK